MKDLKAKITEDIKKTGYITELKVAKILEKDKWETTFGQTYQDFDEGKSREIDIVAYKVLNDKDVNLQLVFNLCIEIKHAPDHPWVIFMTKDSWASYEWSILHCGECYREELGTIFAPGDLNNKPLCRSDGKTGTSFYEAFKKSDATSKIFKALIGASKAAYFQKEQWGEHTDNTKYTAEGQVILEFFIPLVVAEGHLFEAHLKKDDVLVKETSWIPIKLNYSSPNYSKDNRDLRFHPYLSTKGGLPAFLNLMGDWISLVYSNIKKRIKLLR